MKRGAWHQLGWNHHKMVREQLEQNAGVGVIISPRDLTFAISQQCALSYKELGASVLLDPQWHNPSFANAQLSDYPTSELRASVTELGDLSDDAFVRLTQLLVAENRGLQTDAVVAPAVVYPAGRPDIVQLNARLHSAARAAANELGVPCYGTAFLGASVTDSLQLVESTIASITSLNCDGWYFGFEFQAERIPSSTDAVYRCLRAALLLRLTGKPVMHAYAGPMGILSFAVGCEAAASGANQTQWRFCPERWETSASTGGGNGAAPARYFSRGLWGTIVFPDETAFLTPALYSQIVTTTPFAPNPLPQTWTKTEALKHSVYTIAKGIEAVAANNTYGDCRTAADAILENAVGLHAQILEDEIVLKDDSAGYQANWREALRLIAERHQEDFDYLELLG